MSDELVQLSFKISKSLKSELQRLADADRRKLSPYLALVLEQHVQHQKGSGKRR